MWYHHHATITLVHTVPYPTIHHIIPFDHFKPGTKHKIPYTMKASAFVVLTVAAAVQETFGWSVPHLSRREAFEKAAVTSAAVFLPNLPALAEVGEETPRVVSRMGGLLEPYQDGPRGFRLMAPAGWNKFDGEVGAYDLKWQDLVDPTENSACCQCLVDYYDYLHSIWTLTRESLLSPFCS